MSSVEMMKDPLRVGKAIRAQLEQEIPKDLPLDRDFRVRLSYHGHCYVLIIAMLVGRH